MKPLIGNRTEIQQPIQMRFNELIAGVRADVAVKLYGDDLDVMSAQARKIAGILRKIPGAGDVSAEQTDGAPTFDVKIDRQAVAQSIIFLTGEFANIANASRYSMPFFLHPTNDTSLAALPSCVTADRPVRHPPTTAGDYLDERLREIGLKR